MTVFRGNPALLQGVCMNPNSLKYPSRGLLSDVPLKEQPSSFVAPLTAQFLSENGSDFFVRRLNELQTLCLDTIRQERHPRGGKGNVDTTANASAPPTIQNNAAASFPTPSAAAISPPDNSLDRCTGAPAGVHVRFLCFVTGVEKGAERTPNSRRPPVSTGHRFCTTGHRTMWCE